MQYSPSPALQAAASFLSSGASPAKASTTVKLELYGLFKFLTVSQVAQGSRPSIFDMTGRAKWDAWSSASKTYGDRGLDAERRYLEIAQELGWTPDSVPASKSQQSDSDDIWDKEDSNNSGGGGMGNKVSSMVPPEDSSDGKTLHGLAITGDADKLSEFINLNPGLDINERDEFGYTALHLACDRGGFAIAKVLLENGADPSLKDPDEFTAAELASVAGHDHLSPLFAS
ncbi:hypothetical protein BJ138DRAFT_1086736 [Hygrophoropsis aurantiaca]|uniref:Uncharacterized protein n=1 Tax=Hygrophoropsis aurantiaca TaxID=72124 RepID=A0ACB8AC88_9AGAM|nr:hypothetical protein BJ138DRAFT_1086736 [Hygrophoropsis aurantiaca]